MKNQRIWATLHPFFEHGQIMGRSVANEGFINAFLGADPYDGYHFFLADEGAVAAVSGELARRFPARYEAGAFRVTTRHALPEAVADTAYSVFHLSDCVADTVPLMRLRNAMARNIFVITGTTHSLSYPRYSMFFFDQMWAGVTDRDTIIATSRAGEGAVSAMFEAFRAGYGLPADFRAPGVARIPLGVSPDDFAPPEDKPFVAAKLKQQLDIPATDLVLLVFARVSHYSKMDILPLFRALIRAERMGLPKGGYTLVVSGWMDAGDTITDAYAQIAARMGIRFRQIPSPDNAMRKSLFAGADIFLSPVDNPQETFGLTMLEAAAASLPVVASDFDGYRDLVVHGETGFLARTVGPASTPETDALSGVWFDNQYHLQLAQQSVVCVPDLALHISTLASSPALRARFGETARKRVIENYTWNHVVRSHLALWDELAAKPVTQAVKNHPLHPGYVPIFGGYYTELLNLAAGYVRWTDFGEAVYRGQDFPVVYAGVERFVDMDSLRRLLFKARKPILLNALLPGERIDPASEKAAFLVLWALKHDMLETVASTV